MVTYSRIVVDYRHQKDDPTMSALLLVATLLHILLNWLHKLQTLPQQKYCKIMYSAQHYQKILLRYSTWQNWLFEYITWHISRTYHQEVESMPKQKQGFSVHWDPKRPFMTYQGGYCKETPQGMPQTSWILVCGDTPHDKLHSNWLLMILEWNISTWHDANHLIAGWDGALYCGIKLKWDYQKRTLDVSILRYII